ncbi:MAG: hypothetical protein JNM64_18055 [Chloroflexia bacterium]|nr:hypothetical protein [Chloroflexia bacterium]
MSRERRSLLPGSGMLEGSAVDQAEFDMRLGRTARHVTRRSALAATLGGLLLAQAATEGEATKKARRRKARRKRQKQSFPNLKPIYIWVQNPGTKPVTFDYGDGQGSCGVLKRGVVVAPNSRVAVSSGFNESILGTYGFLWINERFWISFTNRPLQRPTLTAVLDGQPVDGGWVCLPPPPGTTIRGAERMDVGALTSFRMADHSFWVSREKDTNYIVFTVILPHTL